MEEIEVTLLSQKQCFGEEQLDILKNYGTNCAATDFAILLGAYVDNDFYVREDSSLRGRTSWWCSSSSNGDGNVFAVSRKDNYSGYLKASKRFGGIRPILTFSNILDILENRKKIERRFFLVEYGEYPQYVVDTNLEMILESKFIAGKIKKTEKTYTTDSRKCTAYSSAFCALEHEEFEYNGKRYIRTKYLNVIPCKLSNGKEYNKGDIVWLEVSPLKWFVDIKAKILLCKTCIASGIRFCNNDEYNGDFKSTEMYKFLNTYFINDIKEKEEVKIEKDVSNKKEEIKELLKEIKKYTEYDLNKDKIYMDLDNLIDRYNENVRRVISSDGLKLESAESYRIRLILQLNDILEKQKFLYEKRYNYDRILLLLKDYKSILEGNEVSSNDELNSYFVDIKKVLSFIDNKELRKEFLDLIETEISKINSFINNEDGIFLEYDNEETFKYYLRTKLQPLLLKLHINAINKDVMEDIRKIVINDMLEISNENGKSMISFYLEEVKTEVKIIMIMDSNDEYRDELNEILNSDINEVKSIDEILKQMTIMLTKLYELEIKIKEELKKQKSIDNNIEKYRVLDKFNK